jgi:hypothetical protein
MFSSPLVHFISCLRSHDSTQRGRRAPAVPPRGERIGPHPSSVAPASRPRWCVSVGYDNVMTAPLGAFPLLLAPLRRGFLYRASAFQCRTDARQRAGQLAPIVKDIQAAGATSLRAIAAGLKRPSASGGAPTRLSTIRTRVIRAARTVAAEAGFRYHALLIVVEIAREMAALRTDEAPRIAIRRLGRRGHHIRSQRQDGENNNKESRLTHLISPTGNGEATRQ